MTRDVGRMEAGGEPGGDPVTLFLKRRRAALSPSKNCTIFWAISI